jgi:hypothetical protein
VLAWALGDQRSKIEIKEAKDQTMMDWIFPKNALVNSPSRADGISENSEKSSRAKTCWFIEMLGKELFKP